jgi:X-Pro dipeptidyl-peptidase
VSVRDNTSLTEDQITATPTQPLEGRLVFASAPLKKDVRISGTVTVTLRIRSDQPNTPITARLIEYGPSLRPVGEGVTNAATSSCWGATSSVDSACYLDVVKDFANSDAAVLCRGWIDAAHAGSNAVPMPLQPGKWRDVAIPLRAQDVLVTRGHTLALALTLSDTEWTTPRSTGATISIDLSRSDLDLPAVGGIHVEPTDAGLAQQHGRGHPLGLSVADTSRVP